MNLGNIASEQLEAIQFLNKHTEGKWTFNKKTGLVDIKGNFDFSDKNLTDFKGVKFGVVTGSFFCDNNKLTSLEGAPQEVRGSFFCDYNKLTSLKGAPQEVKGDFYCDYNKLTSLNGAPQEVRGSFGCRHNQLTSLKGSPQKVGMSFSCSNNKLTSLVGAPQEVGESFGCSVNPISEKTLKLVWETMREKKVEYWGALCMLHSQIESEDWKKMSKGLEDKITPDAIKTYSIISRYR
jgi:hypothetical protein